MRTFDSPPHNAPEARVPERWRPLVRLGVLLFVLVLIATQLAVIPPYFNDLRTVCTQAECEFLALSPREAGALQELGFSLDYYAGYLVGLDVIYLLILVPLISLLLLRRSDTWMGILVSLMLASLFDYNRVPSLDAGLGGIVVLMDFLSSMLLFLVFFVFPDGHFVPHWTRWLLVGVFGIFIVLLFLGVRFFAAPVTDALLNTVYIVTILVGMWSQVHRYRQVSSPAQRQQTKWMILGLIGSSISIIAWVSFVELFPLARGPGRLWFVIAIPVLGLLFNLLPISLAISILRYRLWDIDLVIRRTLSYAVLTGVLALIYFGGVVVIQAVFRGLSGSSTTPLTTVLSTLAIAALFTPLRIRIQAFIDRRFYRAKYDAEQTLAGFAAAARDEVDMDNLTGALLDVVGETMQPENASLWMKTEQPGRQR